MSSMPPPFKVPPHPVHNPPTPTPPKARPYPSRLANGSAPLRAVATPRPAKVVPLLPPQIVSHGQMLPPATPIPPPSLPPVTFSSGPAPEVIRRGPRTRRERVTEFHAMIGAPIRTVPGIPRHNEVRARLRFMMSEMFEALHATFYAKDELDEAERDVQALIDKLPIDVELPEFADALEDLDYFVEGTRLVFGIDGEPIAAEVHKANMAKRAGGTRADGKRMKPPGWKEPNVAACLRDQGWKGDERDP